MLTLLEIALAVAAVLTLGRQIERLNQRCWALVFGDLERARRASFLLVAPGVVIHELSHYAMALLLGEKVGNVNLFKPVYDAPSGHWRLGSVEHTLAPDPWRNLLIGAAPLLVGPLALVAILVALGAPLPANADLGAAPGLFWTALVGAGWKAPLVFYAFLNLGTTVLVSPEDMRELRPAAIFGIPLLLLAALAVGAAPTGVKTAITGALTQAGGFVLFLLVAMVIADLIALVVLTAAYRALGLRTRGAKAQR